MSCPLTSPILDEIERDIALGTPGGLLTDAIVTALAVRTVDQVLLALGLAPLAGLLPSYQTELQRVFQSQNGRDISERVRTEIQRCVITDNPNIGRGSRQAAMLQRTWNLNGDQLAGRIRSTRRLNVFDQILFEAFDRWARDLEAIVECVETELENSTRCSDDGNRPKRCRVPAVVERCVRYDDEGD